MDPRVSFVTLAVPDLEAERAFYVDGLGWPVALEAEGEVLMIQVAEKVVLSLWDRGHFEEEVGEAQSGPGHPPLTLAHNVRSPEEVDAVLEAARVAGAPRVEAGQERAWGGYTGSFADPAGFLWEVAHNPGPIGQAVL